MPEQRLAFDFKSARRSDANGFLHVDGCVLTKADVNEYLGYEIPDYERLGLDPDKTYGVFRPPEELKEAAETINGLPILEEHIMEHSAQRPFRDRRIGSVGTSVEWQDPELLNELTFWDLGSRRDIESGRRCEVSCGYTYDPVLENGEYKGKKYQIRMTNIKFNHVALVEEGRVPGAKVADSQISGKEKSMSKINKRIAPGQFQKGQKLAGDSEHAPAGDEGVGEVNENRVIAGLKVLTEELDKLQGDSEGSVPATDEEKATAAKVRDFLDSFVAQEKSGGDNGEPAKPDASDNQELNARIEALEAELALLLAKREEDAIVGSGSADESNVTDPEKEKTGAADGRKPEPRRIQAIDAETIKRQIREEFQAKERAALDVESLIGSVGKAMSLDSAEAIYRHALSVHGIEIPAYCNMDGLRGMVDVLKRGLERRVGDSAPIKPTGIDAQVMEMIGNSPYAPRT